MISRFIPPMAPIEYTVVRSSRRKTAAIKINDSSVEVRVPTWVSDKWVYTWVESRRNWIEKNQQRLQHNLASSCLNIEQNGVFPYKGKDLSIAWEVGAKSDVKLEGNNLRITLSSRSKKSEKDQLKVLLQRWCKSEAENYLNDRVLYWSKQMGLYPNSMKLKGYRRRWGSCSSDNELTFNWRLIFAEEVLVDYVVIHELAHLKHMNHSAKFWSVVEAYCPSFLILKAELHSKSGWLIW